MVSKTFETGDLVWAKMKGYSPWPGKIMLPPKDAKPKPKKFCHYVFFFGSENHAWIPDDCIESHSEKLLEKYGKKKGGLFRAAVEAIINCSQGASKDHKSKEDLEKQTDDKVTKVKENKSLDKSIQSNRKNKLQNSQSNYGVPKKSKFSVKKVSRERKIVRKRSHSPDHSESESSSLRSENTHSPFSTSEGSTSSKLENMHSSSGKPVESKQIFYTHDDIDMHDPIVKSIEPLPDPCRNYYKCPDIPPVDLTYQSEFFKKKKIEPTKKKIGFLGLGIIGQAIVKNLYHSGHSVTIWDYKSAECEKFTEKFKDKIKVAPTACDVVKVADITFCCLPDSETTKELILGDSGILKEIEHSTRVRKGYIKMTPMDPTISQTIGSEIRMKGGRYLEAPITGSRSEAIESTLLIITAGDKTLYDDCKSCLDAISNKHMFISAEVGAAAKLNVVNNMFTGTVYGGLAEALHLSDNVGLNVEHFYEFLKISALKSDNLLQKVGSMSKHNYVTEISLKQMQNEFNLGLSLGNEISKHTTIMAAANEVYKGCKSLKYDDHDVSAVFEGYRS